MEFSEEEGGASIESKPSTSPEQGLGESVSVTTQKENLSPSIQHPRQGSIQRDKIEEESYYDAIFEFDDTSRQKNAHSSALTSTSSVSTSVHPSTSILKSHPTPSSVAHPGNPISQMGSLNLSSASTPQQQTQQSPKKRQQSPIRPSTVSIGRQSEPLPPPPPPSLPYENFVLDGDTKERRERERERRRRGSREELGSRLSPHKTASSSAVSRRCSDKRTIVNSSGNGDFIANAPPSLQQQKVRRQKGQRSSSLGPLVDDHVIVTSKKSLGSTVHSKENHIGISNMLKSQSKATNTNSLESVDSNPRHAVAKCDQRRSEKDNQAAIRALRATAGPRRPPLNISNAIQPLNSSLSNSQQDANLSTSPSTSSASTHPLIGSPPRHVADLPPGLRPPPYHPLASLQVGGQPIGPPTGGLGHHPPHIPLPGLTCQLSFIPTISSNERPEQRSDSSQQQSMPNSRPCLREQQVLRLRAEIMHPSGVRLTLRKKDCQNSLALVEFFGCVWVVGWKQREFPVLYNAFHIGDQILSVSGVPIKTVHEFNKLVKSHQSRPTANADLKSNPPQQPNSSNPNISNVAHGQLNPLTGSSNSEPLPHVEIIVRRLPFAQGKLNSSNLCFQGTDNIIAYNRIFFKSVLTSFSFTVFYLKRDMDGQLLGIVLQPGSSSCTEIKEISPGSPAALAGMTTKIRSFNDSSTLVPWCITEINGRPLNMSAKEGEAMERLQALGNVLLVKFQASYSASIYLLYFCIFLIDDDFCLLETVLFSFFYRSRCFSVFAACRHRDKIKKGIKVSEKSQRIPSELDDKLYFLHDH